MTISLDLQNTNTSGYTAGFDISTPKIRC